MSGDYSRFGFDPTRNYASVLLQQGRPLTDRDWNDQSVLTARRDQAAAFDTMGQAVVPASTPGGFAISFDSTGKLQIGRGRMYVDGLLVENHGTGLQSFDPVLGENFGGSPTPYSAQPYMPNAPALPASGQIAIAYLDVWEREVTRLEDPLLVEPALGVDTTTRRQTVWQVRFLGGQAAGTTCATPVSLPAPSGGRLSTAAKPVPGQSNPCIIPPSAGYTGLENQLYRIEIQQGGAPGTATFKWSRDNASVEARVLRFVDLSHIVVDSVGRDDVLRFSDGDWIEITDDWREFSQTPGELHRITVGGGVDDATRTITLDTPVTAGLFPTDAQGNLTASRNTRIRRWDQQGKVLDQNGNTYVDLGAAGSTGVITVPAASGTSILLENGVLASFAIDPSGGAFQPFDYWVFAARANDGTVETLLSAPPRGIRHHYARLAVVTFPGTVTADCRVSWPPVGNCDGCGCTASVTPLTHQNGTYTIQKAVDDVSKTGGTVCLTAGSYALTAPVTIGAVASLRIVGEGEATIITAASTAFSITGGGDIRLEELQITGGASLAVNGASSIQVDQTASLTINRVVFVLTPTANTGAAIAFGSLPIGATVTNCTITAPSGIVYTPPAAPASVTGAPAAAPAPGAVYLVVRDNLFQSSLDAVTIFGQTASSALVEIKDNRINGCVLWGIGLQFPGIVLSSVRVEANFITTFGYGIAGSANGFRILDNDIGFFGAAGGTQDGIMLWSLYTTGIVLADCEISGNRIGGFGGGGVAIRSPVNRAIIERNQIGPVGDGIVLQYTNSVLTLPTAAITIENNQIADVGLPAASADAARSVIAAGIWVNQAASVHVAHNTILRVGLFLPVAQGRVGIFIVASDRAAVSGNEVSDVGPVGDFVGPSTGIAVVTPFGGVDITGNLSRRFSPGLGVTTVDSSDWTPLLVLGPAPAATDKTYIPISSRFATTFVRTINPIALNLSGALKLNTAANTTVIRSAMMVASTNATGAVAAATSAAAAAAVAASAPPVVVRPAPVPKPAPIRVAARGNQLEGYGSQAVVLIHGQTDCVFSDNHCALETPANQTVSNSDVLLSALTVVASGNRVTGGPVAMSVLAPSPTACSIVGNLTLGTITLNGAALGAPWAALNIGGG
nr:DUF6519 domain-containing protein [uncultured Rhodopila sp.]